MFFRTRTNSSEPSAESFATDQQALIQLFKQQQEIIKRLERIDARLDSLVRAQDISASVLGSLKNVLDRVLSNHRVFYSKFLLTRLNLLEISQGKTASISENEHQELENSKREHPDPSIATLPRLHKEKPSRKRGVH